jgi:GH18 family chitinase
MKLRSWWDGQSFLARFTITNEGTAEIPAGWTLTWDVTGPYAWNITSVYHDSVTLSYDPATDRDTLQGSLAIPAGEKVVIEFQASQDSVPSDYFDVANPENVLLNGEPMVVHPHNVYDLAMQVVDWQAQLFDGSFTITNRDTVEVASGWSLRWETSGTYAWKIIGLYEPNATFTRDDAAGHQYITGDFPIPAGGSVSVGFQAELPSVPPHDAWIPDPENVKLDKGLLRVFERETAIFATLGMAVTGWWGSTFNARFTIRNDGPKDIPEGWDLTWALPSPYTWHIRDVYEPSTSLSRDSLGNDVLTGGFTLPTGRSKSFEFQAKLDTTPTDEPLIPDPQGATLKGTSIRLQPRHKQTLEMGIVGRQVNVFDATYTIWNEDSVEVQPGWELAWGVDGPYAWRVLQVYEPSFTFQANAYGDDVIVGSDPIPPGGSARVTFQAEALAEPPADNWILDPELVTLNGAAVHIRQREVIDPPSIDRTPLPVNTAPGPKRLAGYYGDWSPGMDQYFPWDIPAEKLTHVLLSFLAPGIHFPEYGTAGTEQITEPDGTTGSLYELLRAESPEETVKGLVRAGLHGPLSSDQQERWEQRLWWLPRPSDADLTGRLAEASAGVWYVEQALLWNRRFHGAEAAKYEEAEPLPPYGADEPVSGFSPSGSGGGPSPEHAMGNYRHLFGLRDGVRRWEEDPQAPGSYRYVQVAAPRNPDLRILVSIGGWGLSEMFSVICSDARLRGQFVNEAVAFLQRWQLDGLDIDWEHPGTFRWKDEISGRKADRIAFHLLLKELRAALDALGPNPRSGAPYELTAAVTSTKSVLDFLHDGSTADNDELAANGLQPWWTYLDAVHLMTYDQFGPWERLTYHHTPLWPDRHYPREFTRREADLIRSYLNIHGAAMHCGSLGMPAGKLNVGGAFYARGVWGVADPGANPYGLSDGGLYEEHLAFGYDDDVDPDAVFDRLPPGTFSWASTSGGWACEYEFWDLDQHYRGSVDPVLETRTGSGGTAPYGAEYFERPFYRFWEERVCAPWLFSRAKGRGWFISYEDPESLGWKADYAWARNLGGVFFWALAGDDGGASRTRSRRARGRHQLVRSYWGHLRLGEIASLELWTTALVDDYFTSAGEWLDRSRHARRLGVVGTVPARVSNAINNKGAVRFDGTGRYVPSVACMPAGAMHLAVNGAEAASGAAPGANANTSLIVGSHGSGVDPLQGEVAEVLVFSADLAPGSEAAEILREYLFARYNYDVSDSVVVHGPEGLVVPPKTGTGIVPPVEVPAHCGLLQSGDGGVSVPITFIPMDREARADYAVGSTAPDPGSAEWTYFGRTAAEATLSTPTLPAGSTVWIRLRSERQGYASSAWTAPESVQL